MVFKKTRYIGIGRYEKNYIGILSVSADMKKSVSVVPCYQYISSVISEVNSECLVEGRLV